ncbi:hypothetical protein NLU13_9527 [Sarocladium strictum]|uniref:RING-type domain-containing protein n=1 Tax=Sarocladium strictum TaxID=5046 RepID=A0AA39GAM5_SARSR|nr:hypothetical protein NLU13_9527 [Sarocladium strictum]
MATQYEIEHNIKFTEARRGRRVDMASFFNLLSRVAEPDMNSPEPRHNPHATPTPVDTAALFRLLQDQLQTLHATSPDANNRGFLEDLILSLDADIHDPPARIQGVSQEFVDSLDRVDRKRLRKDDDCAICKVPYLEDEYCLVVELPCKGAHRYDLECVGPWLRSKGTCPMCRQEMGKKKAVPVVEDDDEESDGDMMYA